MLLLTASAACRAESVPSADADVNSVTPLSSSQSPCIVVALSPETTSVPAPVFATVPSALRTGAPSVSVPPCATSTPAAT